MSVQAAGSTIRLVRAQFLGSGLLASQRGPVQRFRSRSQRSQQSDLTTTTTLAFPRQSTPFQDQPSAAEEAQSEQRSTVSSNDKGKGPARAEVPWYIQEVEAESAEKARSMRRQDGSSYSPSTTIRKAPSPPSALPTFLHPLWQNLHESPFFDRRSIKFIDSRTAQASVSSDQDSDASVSSWVDWVVIAILRNGRERGIRGASDSVQLAMKDSLRLLAEERAAASDPNADTGAKPQRRRKIGRKVLVEGLDVKDPQWCLVDGGQAIVHIMTQTASETWEVESVALAGREGVLTSEPPVKLPQQMLDPLNT